MKILIKNGYVYDPLNKIDGEIMDIAIENGKIVESVSGEVIEIDAKNMIVMPGGVDLHSHIAGSKVNAGRLLRPEDHYKDVEKKTNVKRSGVGHTVPSTFTTGYRYSEMGYTTVMEAATPPLKTRHTHEELNDMPMIDKACLSVLDNNWIVLDYLSKNELEKCAAFIGWILNAIKGYGIKIVNPGGVELWGWGKNVKTIDDQVPPFNITPREIIRGLCKVNKMLNLPHTIHLHTNNLGTPGNYRTLIESMKCVSDLSDGSIILHVTHVQFCGYKGYSWITLSSGADEIAKFVNENKYVTLDLGQIVFGDATTMTADGPFQYILYSLSKNKWINTDVEAETSAGIVPYRFKKKNYVNAIQWSIGLELALLIKDPWRVFLTTDHPNAGLFTSYPKLIAWLMSNKAREKILKKVNKRAKSKMILPSLEREYSFYEIAIVTRAGTAKALGLKNKGHLGIGADADIAIYDINPKEIDPSKEYKKVRKAFRKAAYTIKDGKIVCKNGEVVENIFGRTYWVNVDIPKDLLISTISEVKEKFEEYYTVKMENYAIHENELLKSAPLKINSNL
jgi:formylmethanofuran dehydrogenase subunit A